MPSAAIGMASEGIHGLSHGPSHEHPCLPEGWAVSSNADSMLPPQGCQDGAECVAEVTAKAAERFHESHLSTFAWPLAERLEMTEVRYLSLGARALAQRVGPPKDSGSTGDGLPILCDSDCPAYPLPTTTFSGALL